MIDKGLLDILVCPSCKADISPEGDLLTCVKCGRQYPVKDGIPVMLIEDNNEKDTCNTRP